MSVGIVQFNADIDKLAAAVKALPATVMKKVVVEAYNSITELTPVDTGRARSSWAMSIATPSDYLPPDMTPAERSTWNKTKGPKPPLIAKPDIPFDVVARIDAKQPVYITSNLPYIEALEEGHSSQSPAGMVRITIAALELGIDSIVAQP